MTALALLLFSGVAIAQGEVAEVPAFDLGDGASSTELLVIGALVFFLGSVGRDIIVNRRLTQLQEHYHLLVTNSVVRDSAEATYARSSIRVQDATQFAERIIRAVADLNLPLIDGILDDTADFLEDVTDSAEDTPPPDQPQ